MSKSNFWGEQWRETQTAYRWGQWLGENFSELLAGIWRFVADLFQRREPTGEVLTVGVGYPYGDHPRQQLIQVELDRLQNTHLLCTGGSGSGKTVLLYSLAIQLMSLSEAKEEDKDEPQPTPDGTSERPSPSCGHRD